MLPKAKKGYARSLCRSKAHLSNYCLFLPKHYSTEFVSQVANKFYTNYLIKTMKKKIFLLIGIITVGLTAFSQVTTQEIELVKSILKSERKVFFVQNMQLSTEEFNRFWPIYDKYQEEESKVQASVISDYKKMVNQSDELTDEELEKININYFKRRKKMVALQLKYYKMVKKELGVGAATRFLQIDRFVDATIRATLFSEMPLIQKK